VSAISSSPRLTGEIPTNVDHALVTAMVDMNARFAGLLSNRPDLPSIPLFLRASGPGFCLHDPLRQYDRRTARLLAWVHEVGATRDQADGDDLVHFDFHTANVLVGPESKRITGIVDWDGAGRGDRRLDLVTLRFDVARRAPDELPWLDEVLAETLPQDRLRAYWAHMSLRHVDWSIRHHTSADVDFWLGVVEPGLK